LERNILIDAGPLIALFSSRDHYHSRAVSFIRSFDGLLWSTWPVITEASHMLSFNIQAQLNLLKWISRGGIQMIEVTKEDIELLVDLTHKYQDVPMDLADATLIVAAEKMNIKQIASIDSDFYVYRTVRNEYLRNLFL
jgi:predicted nucleic acid-binding protein